MTSAAFDVPFELPERAVEDRLREALLFEAPLRDDPLREEPLRDDALLDEPLREDALREEPLLDDRFADDLPPEEPLRDDALVLLGLDPFELRLFEVFFFVPDRALLWAIGPLLESNAPRSKSAYPNRTAQNALGAGGFPAQKAVQG